MQLAAATATNGTILPTSGGNFCKFFMKLLIKNLQIDLGEFVVVNILWPFCSMKEQ